MSRSGSAAVAVVGLAGALLAFALGVTWARWPSLQFENRLDWVALLGFIGAIINALVIVFIAFKINQTLADRAVGRRFEKDLIVGFARSGLSVAQRIEEFFHQCAARFSDEDRQNMVQLFACLAQEIYLMEETTKLCAISSDVKVAALARGEYKDVLTDHPAGVPFTPDEKKTAGMKYGALRRAFVNIIVDVNRSL